MRGGVLFAIPAGIFLLVSQAEIGRQIDDIFRQPGKLFDPVLGLPVGQRQEEHVAGLYVLWIAELELRAFAQVGVNLVNVAAQVAARGDLGHLYLRVVEQQAQQFAAGVARSTYDGCTDHGSTSISRRATASR